MFSLVSWQRSVRSCSPRRLVGYQHFKSSLADVNLVSRSAPSRCQWTDGAPCVFIDIKIFHISLSASVVPRACRITLISCRLSCVQYTSNQFKDPSERARDYVQYHWWTVGPSRYALIVFVEAVGWHRSSICVSTHAL